MEEKEKEKMWSEIKDKLREEETKFHELFIAKMWEVVNNAPPGSMAHFLKLIAIVQDRAPEAGDAIFQLIKRYFRRRGVLFIVSERLRLEEMWRLDLSKDPYTSELNPLNYERDVAPLPLLETIEECGNFLLGDLKNRMRNTMRNYIVRGGAQGRNIDTKEVEREYRLKEYLDQDNSHEILPNLSKWNSKEGFFEKHDQYNNPDYTFQYSTWASPAFRADPWDPQEVIDITEEDKPLWDAISKAIPLLDDIDQLLVKSIMYKIPIVKISKETGIPEGTLRSRKSRLRPKVLKIATKYLSSSVSYMAKNKEKNPAKKGQKPANIGP